MQVAVVDSPSLPVSSSAIRLNGLDALRVVAAFLVVLLHAGIPYMTNPLPFLVWPARDMYPCVAVDGLTWCIECFIMPLFFVLAGFFSQGLLVSRGERGFLSERTKRLLSTQVVAGLAILPLCFFVWLLGWTADGLCIPKHLTNYGLSKELKADLFGMAHLWFLQNLYIYCVILCAGSWLLKRVRQSKSVWTKWNSFPFRSLDNVLRSVWKPLLPAIPCAIIVYFDTRIVLGFYQVFVPALSKLIYYAIYFFVGASLYGHRESLQLHARFGKRYLFVAAILFATMLPMIHEHTNVAMTGVRLALLASLLAMFAWFATFGLIAIFLRINYGECPVTQYLAQASFWIYLIHLPFVALAQIAIAQLPIPAFAKFLLAGMTGLALALMTYHVFVRDRWIGNFLKGGTRPCETKVNDPEPFRRPYPAIVTHYTTVDRVSRLVEHQ